MSSSDAQEKCVAFETSAARPMKVAQPSSWLSPMSALLLQLPGRGGRLLPHVSDDARAGYT